MSDDTGENQKDRVGIRCSHCEQVKSAACFNRDRRAAGGLRSECRECQRHYNERFRSSKPLYNIWNLMMQRCYNPRHQAYAHYGARGIEVCERWQDYEAFFADMSPRPSPQHSIDRIDNDGPYSPDNCRWATQQQQVLNQRSNRLITIAGVTRTLSEWARLQGIPKCTVEARIYRYGWDEVAALTKPPRRYHKTHGSESLSV